MLLKIKVACDSRSSADFLIIARTDSRTSLGLDEAIRRGEAFAQAGADVVFIEAPESELRDGLDRQADRRTASGQSGQWWADAIAACRQTRGDRLSYRDLPAAGFLAAAAGLETAYRDIKDNGTSTDTPMYSFDTFNKLIGFPEVWDFEKRIGLTRE